MSIIRSRPRLWILFRPVCRLDQIRSFGSETDRTNDSSRPDSFFTSFLQEQEREKLGLRQQEQE